MDKQELNCRVAVPAIPNRSDDDERRTGRYGVHLYQAESQGEKPAVIVVLSERRENLAKGRFPAETAATNGVSTMLSVANVWHIWELRSRGLTGTVPVERMLRPSDITVILHIPDRAREDVPERFEQHFFVGDSREEAGVVEDTSRAPVPISAERMAELIGPVNLIRLPETMRQPEWRVIQQDRSRRPGLGLDR